MQTNNTTATRDAPPPPSMSATAPSHPTPRLEYLLTNIIHFLSKRLEVIVATVESDLSDMIEG
jgi:hypothetical protein